MNRIILCLILLLQGCLCNGGWTRGDSIREASYLGMAVIDWGQTLHVADNPNKFYERNALLGDHPSRGDVNLYMPSMMFFHALVSCALPSPYRAWWQYGTIAVEGVVIVNNHRIGIRPTF